MVEVVATPAPVIPAQPPVPASVVTPATPAVPVVTPTAPVTPPAPSWRDGLDPEITKSVEKYGTPHEVAKGYHELAKKLGERTDGMVKIPGADAKPEEEAAFRVARGVPEKPEGYPQFDIPEPLRAVVTPESAAAFSPIFHKAGLSPREAGIVTVGYAEVIQGLMAKQQQDFAAEREKDRRTQGDATYTYNLTVAEKAIEELCTTEEIAMFNKGVVPGDPRMTRFWSRIGQKLVESGHLEGSELGLGPKGQAEAYITACKDPKHPVNNPKDPGYPEALEKRRQAYVAMYGASPV